MNELNLHNRLPNDLPDKQTIKDILLELEDTNKFDIKLINLQSTKVDGGKWHANNKPFHEWVEQGEVKICEAVYPYVKYDIVDNNSELFNKPSLVTIKETNYHIIRYPMRLDITLKCNTTLNKDLIDIIQTYKDVYLRLKDYLGPDVIGDQLGDGIVNGFIIDFIISRVKLVSPNEMRVQIKTMNSRFIYSRGFPVEFVI